jgi:hypothetical protein
MEKILDYCVQLDLQPIDQYFNPYHFLQKKRTNFKTLFYGKNLQLRHLAKIIAWVMVYGDKMTIELKLIDENPLFIKIEKNYKGIQIYKLNNPIHIISLMYISNVEKIEFDLTFLFNCSCLNSK